MDARVVSDRRTVDMGLFQPAALTARLDQLPMSRTLYWMRGIVGMATFFDGYTTLAIAYALPTLTERWHLSPTTGAAIISAGYLGQLVGAIFFGYLAERIGRVPVLTITIAIFAAMSLACIFAWNAPSLMLFRFLQGIGTGGEVPVASAYVNEFAVAKRRGRFFLLYELLFLVGLVFSGLIGYAFVPTIGWRAMFIVGVVPALLVVPLQFFLPESPRWLISKGRLSAAARVISRLEGSRIDVADVSTDPVEPRQATRTQAAPNAWREMFGRFYGRRTLLLWSLWFGTYLINNGLVTWLPTLYRTAFHVPLDRSIGYGFAMTGVAVVASLVCALSIDRVGRRRWYAGALFLSAIALASLWLLNAASAVLVFWLATAAYASLQTVTYSLYLYSGELYPTRLRSLGAGLGSAWLRLGSMAGPWIIGMIVARGSIAPVFAAFALLAAITGLVCVRWAPETSGRSLEELSP